MCHPANHKQRWISPGSFNWSVNCHLRSFSMRFQPRPTAPAPNRSKIVGPAVCPQGSPVCEAGELRQSRWSQCQCVFSGQPLSYPGEKMLWSAFQASSKRLWTVLGNKIWQEQCLIDLKNMHSNFFTKLHSVQRNFTWCIDTWCSQWVVHLPGRHKKRSRNWNGRLNNQDLPAKPHGPNCQSVKSKAIEWKFFETRNASKQLIHFFNQESRESKKPASILHLHTFNCMHPICIHTQRVRFWSMEPKVRNMPCHSTETSLGKALSTRRLHRTAPHKSFETLEALTFQLKGFQIHVLKLLKRGLSPSAWAKGIECIPRCGTWTLRCSAEITRADFTTAAGLVFFWWALRADRMRGYSIWTCTGWTWTGVWYPEE